MRNIRIFTCQLPKNARGKISLILSGDNATLVARKEKKDQPSSKETKARGLVEQDIIFAVPMNEEDSAGDCIAYKDKGKIVLVDLSDPKNPKASEAEEDDLL